MPTTPESILQYTLQKMRQRLQNEQSQSSSYSVQNKLVFAGNIHDAIPRQLLLESRLSPFDKMAWMMIRLHAQQNEGAVFPTYDDLQFQLASPHSHKASRETVSRALLMLRLTGWLSLCHRVRDKRGRIRGNIYMLHDEPVNAFDAETLDPRWMDVLEKSCYHPNKSVRTVALSMLNALKTDPSMQHQHTRMTLIGQRLESIQTPEALANRQQLILNTQHTQSQPDKYNKNKHKKNRTQCKTPGSKIELSTKNGEKIPGSKIELSTQTQSDSGVRKSNCYVRNSFTQSVKNTYVNQGMQYSAYCQVPLEQVMDDDDRVMLEKQLQALPKETAISIVQQLGQGLSTGSVRNPVGYMLQLLKAAREGRYNSISFSDTGLKGAGLQKTERCQEASENSQVISKNKVVSQRRKTTPEVAHNHLQRIRRQLAGITDE
ncbi:STY4528 family pathogenicity island replication protein [Proteus mirabilis]|nr:helix-turn-helix domain-containing protein [Escherichia coli]EKU2367719.1 helix-turn-helix domain-containing protein [Proteus mirabilis]HBU0172481.1 helix-turn-helix domain-containing protein [Klebsiella pneumoniae]EJY1963151.1 helix-turn-helix domain-containing protein [Escherichia coli]EKU7915422.1 helix-turn-helix domain-containing protein [Proteus mirabilis]